MSSLHRKENPMAYNQRWKKESSSTITTICGDVIFSLDLRHHPPPSAFAVPYQTISTLLFNTHMQPWNHCYSSQLSHLVKLYNTCGPTDLTLATITPKTPDPCVSTCILVCCTSVSTCHHYSFVVKTLPKNRNRQLSQPTA